MGGLKKKKKKSPGKSHSPLTKASHSKHSKGEIVEETPESGEKSKGKHGIPGKSVKKKVKRRVRVRRQITFENDADHKGNIKKKDHDISTSKAKTRRSRKVHPGEHTSRSPMGKHSRSKKDRKRRHKTKEHTTTSSPSPTSVAKPSQNASKTEPSVTSVTTGVASSMKERVALSRTFYRALKTILVTGRFLGRFPLHYRITREGFLEFDGNLKQLYMITFLITNIFFTILFILGVWTAYAFWLAVPIGPDYLPGRRAAKIAELKSVPNFEVYLALNKNESGTKLDDQIWAWYLRNRYERYIFNRHIIFFIMHWCYLLHNVISGWIFFVHRQTIVNYFNFWARAIVVLNMDMTEGILRNILIVAGTYGTLAVVMTFMSFFKTLASSVGLPAVLAIILGRNFKADLIGHWPGTVQAKPELVFLMHISHFLNLYMFFSSKFYIILLLFCTHCLHKGFDRWNGRCYTHILKASSNEIPKESRQIYESLYKDHTTLLDLVEGTDNVFALITESFLGLQTMSLCFELYFVIKSAKKEDDLTVDKTNSLERENDWIAGFMVCTANIISLVTILRACASVGEEAMSGLEIIRRKTMVGRRSDDELLFAMSMLSSYTAFNPIAIVAGGFFICDKSLMVAILGTVLSYFTIIYQFEPGLDFHRESGDPQADCIRAVVETIEFGASSGSAASKPCMVY